MASQDKERPTRRLFAAGGGAAFATIGVVRAPAKAAQFDFKCGSAYTRDDPSSVRLTQMWRAIERESGGRIHTEFFPNGVLGGAPAMLSQLRLGAINFLIIGGGLNGVVPASNICYLGFAYKDADDANRVYDGPVGAYVRNEAATKGMHILRTIWESEMRQVGSNSHPIRNPDDFRGFKIKVLGQVSVDVFKTLGAIPIELPLGEAYTGLQTRLIDGEDSTLDAIYTQRLYEANKYVSLTNHGWGGQWLAVNADSWKSLPPDLQEIIERNNTKYARLNHRDVKLELASIADKLTRLGITINTGVDQAPFRARLRSYYEYWSNAFGPTAWGLLQSSLGYKLL
jgi:TRAP-type transport system periplasmic protein